MLYPLSRIYLGNLVCVDEQRLDALSIERLLVYHLVVQESDLLLQRVRAFLGGHLFDEFLDALIVIVNKLVKHAPP